MEGQASDGLGNIHAIMGDVDQSRQLLTGSIEKPEKVSAAHHLKAVKTLIASLN